MAYEVKADAQRIDMATSILDKFAKQLATISRITQKQLHEVLGHGAAATVFALTDQAVVRALTFDAWNLEVETLVPIACDIARRIPPVAASMHAHQVNCNQLGHPVHNASYSNVLTRSMKPEEEFKAEKRMHAAAGIAKHSFTPEGSEVKATGTTLYLDNLLHAHQGESTTDEQGEAWESRPPRCRRNKFKKERLKWRCKNLVVADKELAHGQQETMKHDKVDEDPAKTKLDGQVHDESTANLLRGEEENLLMQAEDRDAPNGGMLVNPAAENAMNSCSALKCPFEVGQNIITASRATEVKLFKGGWICGMNKRPCKVLQLPDLDHPGQVFVQFEHDTPRDQWRYKGWMPIGDLQANS